MTQPKISGFQLEVDTSELGIDTLASVDATNPLDGDVLTWNSTSTQWEPTPLPAQVGIGINQTWQDVTLTRSANVVYTNSTGVPIVVSIRVTDDASAIDAALEIGAGSPPLIVSSVAVGSTTPGDEYTLRAEIPAGESYSLALITGTVVSWAELR